MKGFLPRHRLVLAAAAVGLSLLAATVAQAFTIENQDAGNSGAAARYTDPNPPASSYGTIGTSNGPVIRQGNTTFQLGGAQQGGSFNQRYDSSRMFDPLGRPAGR